LLERKYCINKYLSALTRQHLSSALAKVMVDPCSNLSVFDLERCSKTPSFVKLTNSQESCSLGDVLMSYEFQVNSAGLRKAAKATVNTAMRLMSLYQLLLRDLTMDKSRGLVISPQHLMG